MTSAVTRPEIDQLEKRFEDGFTHVNKGLTDMSQVLTNLASVVTDLKVTQERIATSMEEQEKILAKVTDTEDRCTDLEHKYASLKKEVTHISNMLQEERKDKKDNAKWKRRIGVTTVIGLGTAAWSLLLKFIFG